LESRCSAQFKLWGQKLPCSDVILSLNLLATGKQCQPMQARPSRRLSAINYNMSHNDVVGHLQQLDRAFGLSVIHAKYDGLEVQLTKLPPDLNAFVRQEKGFCPDAEESELLKDLKTNRTINYWWD